MESFPQSPVALDSQAPVDPNSFIHVTFRYGGNWVDVKNQSRQRYAGGHQKTIKYERGQLNLLNLREEVEDICSWVQEHHFELFYHIPRASPKQYKILCDDEDVENFRRQLWQCSRAEVVVITHNHRAESLHLQISGLSCTPDVDEILQPNIVEVQLDDKLLVGSRFSDAKAFKQILRTEAIVKNYGVKITASDKTRVLATCSYTDCPWRIRAALCNDGHTFEVRKLVGPHSCPGINRADNRQATSDWVATEIRDLVKQQPNLPPKQINISLKSSYGLSLSYMKLWRSREQARESVFGAIDDSYRWVLSLQAELLKRNPGSNITYFTTGPDNSFKRFYVSFKVSIDGFVSGCRPLIGLDACHLKSKYLGVLLSANTLDGNNSLFTIAFAAVEAESKSTWTWFLENLSVSIGFELYPLAFISDMEKCLLEAVKSIFPNSEHRVCLRHLWKNIKKQFRCQDGHKVHSLVWSAANTYVSSEFESKLNDLCNVSPEVYSYLTSLPYLWSRCQFSTEIKNDSNTNNMAESFNLWISEARNKPVVDLINTVRGMLMSQRANRNITSANWRSEIVPFAEEYIREISTRKQHFLIRQSTIFRCEVEGTNDRHEVDTQISECTCMYWQMTGLPCIHAVAFISTRQHPPWHTYIDSYYSVYRYRLAYEGAISTMPSKEQWQHVDDSVAVGILSISRPRGRPRTKRLRNFIELEQGKSRKK